MNYTTNKRKRTLLATISVLLLTILAAACGTATDETLYGEDPTREPGLPPEAALEAQRWLAEQLDVEAGTVEIQVIEQAEWMDSCLGLGGPNEACLQVITPGYRIVLSHAGSQYEVRTNEDGSTIRLVPSS